MFEKRERVGMLEWPLWGGVQKMARRLACCLTCGTHKGAKDDEDAPLRPEVDPRVRGATRGLATLAQPEVVLQDVLIDVHRRNVTHVLEGHLNV